MVAINHPLPVSLRPLRLPSATYRRRRLAALGVLLLVATLVLAAVTALTARPALGPRPAATVTYVVRPGDSLWTIADELVDGADLRPVVDALAAANGGAALVPGQQLTVTLP